MSMETLSNLTINFNLRQPKSMKPTNVYCVVKVDGKQLKLPIGCKVAPYYWDKKKQQPIINNGMSEAEKQNILNVLNVLNVVKFGFLNYFSYICNTDELTSEKVKDLIINLLDNDNMTNEQNLRKGTGRTASATKTLQKAFDVRYNGGKAGTISTAQSKLNQFFAYCHEIGKDTVSMLTTNGIEDYKQYLLKNSDNSNKQINNLCQQIVTLINNVLAINGNFRRYGVKKVDYIKLEEVNAKGEDKKRRPLKDDELQKLMDCDNLTEKEIEYRDLFILQCHGAYRVSDTQKIFAENKQICEANGYKFIVFDQQKTGNEAVVWIDSVVSEILDKYKDGFKYAKPTSKNYDSQLNKYLKAICQKAGLDSVESWTDAHGKTQTAPLYEMIGSHFARYTFVYNAAVKYGLDKDKIKYFTGHKSDKIIDDVYLIIDNDGLAKTLANALESSNVGNAQQITATQPRQTITAQNINEQQDLIKEVKEAIFCLGGDLNDLIDVNDYHTLNRILYCNYHEKYEALGCKMGYIKELYGRQDLTLKEKRELINKVIEEVKSKKNSI